MHLIRHFRKNSHKSSFRNSPYLTSICMFYANFDYLYAMMFYCICSRYDQFKLRCKINDAYYMNSCNNHHHIINSEMKSTVLIATISSICMFIDR